MLSVGAREKAGVSIKYSVMALGEISHSQICDPESVRLFFHGVLVFFFGWPRPINCKTVSGEGGTN